RFSLLDVGFGDGDMLRKIDAWAQKRGIEAHLTGIDLNPRSKVIAETKPSLQPITYLSRDYVSLAGRGFDCVISSLVAHHMSEEELATVVGFMQSEASLSWFVNDVHRYVFAYNAWTLLVTLMGWHRSVRLDGSTPIGRSF